MRLKLYMEEFLLLLVNFLGLILQRNLIQHLDFGVA